jgi:hypothetical protein
MISCLAFVASPALGADCTGTSTGLVPLTDLGPGLYLGQFQGGLYPGGLNAPPAAHLAAGVARAALIVPRNTSGAPAANGKMVLVSVGMSNTTQEFCSGTYPSCATFSFVGQAAAHPGVNHSSLLIVDGAAGGQTTVTWDSPTDVNYDRVRDTRLTPLGASEAQVQAVWLKVANPGPAVSLPFASADANTLVSGMGSVVRALKVRYPNLQLVFVSSRIYAGYADTTLNPEPFAYESGFAAKWLIEAQINQMAGGGVHPLAGNLDPAVAPLLVWGPYLWADGLNPRSDGLTWACSDFNTDGTHPITPARTKVGTMLLNNLLASPFTAGWFRPGPPCVADLDNGSGNGTPDGGVDINDLLYFLTQFENGNPLADLDNDGNPMVGTPDGGVDVNDLLFFLARFEGGC